MLDKKPLEERVRLLEEFVSWAKPVITEASKQLDIGRPHMDPSDLCKDTLDMQIINYLIDNYGAGTTEIARGLNLPNPEGLSRHTVGKRLLRMAKELASNGPEILIFERAVRTRPDNKEKKFRAWWLRMEDVDVEKFKINYETQMKKVK